MGLDALTHPPPTEIDQPRRGTAEPIPPTADLATSDVGVQEVHGHPSQSSALGLPLSEPAIGALEGEWGAFRSGPPVKRRPEATNCCANQGQSTSLGNERRPN